MRDLAGLGCVTRSRMKLVAIGRNEQEGSQSRHAEDQTQDAGHSLHYR